MKKLLISCQIINKGITQFEAVLNATPLALNRVGNISDGMVHAIGPHETPYDSVNPSTSDTYEGRIQINPAQMFPSTVCPRQSRPTIPATIATPRCAIVIPIYTSMTFLRDLPILREVMVAVRLNQA